MRALRKLRRAMYRGASILGDVNAGARAYETRSADPVIMRVARKGVWRKTGGVLGRLMRTR